MRSLPASHQQGSPFSCNQTKPASPASSFPDSQVIRSPGCSEWLSSAHRYTFQSLCFQPQHDNCCDRLWVSFSAGCSCWREAPPTSAVNFWTLFSSLAWFCWGFKGVAADQLEGELVSLHPGGWLVGLLTRRPSGLSRFYSVGVSWSTPVDPGGLCSGATPGSCRSVPVIH